MGEMMIFLFNSSTRFAEPFNGPIEIGLRALSVLTEGFPREHSLQRLIVFDYLLIHSDDVPEGPTGLHPQTPHRGGELLVRRVALRQGLLLYQSRGLVQTRFGVGGVFFTATERSAAFMDALRAAYTRELRSRATWVVERFGGASDEELQQMVREHIGEWGAEFEMESALWAEDPQ
jgi:hypothetical protein